MTELNILETLADVVTATEAMHVSTETAVYAETPHGTYYFVFEKVKLDLRYGEERLVLVLKEVERNHPSVPRQNQRKGPWYQDPDGFWRDQSGDLVCDVPISFGCSHLNCNVGKGIAAKKDQMRSE